MNDLTNIKFIYEKPKKYTIIFVIYILLIIFFIILSFNIKIYSKLKVKATLLEDKIVVPMILDNVDKIEKSTFLKLDDKKYNFKILEYGEIYNDGNVNIQDVVIESKIDKKLKNQIFELTFYFDEEKIIKKIVKGVLE